MPVLTRVVRIDIEIDPYTAAWCTWLASFAVVETLAYRRGSPGSTLSGHLWRAAAVGGGDSLPCRARRAALLTFLAWLTGHLVGGPTLKDSLYASSARPPAGLHRSGCA